MIDHRRARELAAGAVDDLITPEERTLLELHRRGCPACRAEATAFARDRDALRDLEPIPVSPRVRRRLDAKLRDRPSGLRWPLLAAAALLLGLGATTLLSIGGPRTPAPNQPTGPRSDDSAIASGLGFREPVTVDAGGAPRTVDIGDIDGDGDFDLVYGRDVVGGAGTRELVVLLGDGRGAFGGSTTIAAGDEPVHRLVDLDADGRADLLSIDRRSGEAVIRYAEGRAAFAEPRRIAIGPDAREVLAADMDGDGDADLVTADGSRRTVSVIRLDGRSGETPITSFATPGSADRIAVADEDGDGELDVAVGLSDPASIAVLWGSGDGRLTSSTTVAEGIAAGDLVAGDVDGDGDDDLVASHHDPDGVRIFAANPAGPFWDVKDVPTPGGEADGPRDVEIADVDGDGIGDIVLVAAGDRSDVVVWTADGRGGMRPPVTFPVGSGPSELEVRDLDGDGRQDIVVANAADQTIAILLAD
jgi:hypothetical protein